MSTQPETFLSEQEYLEIERKAERKSEYYQGHMFLMAGGTLRHSVIIGNIVRDLGVNLKGRPCLVCPTDLRLRVSPSGLYTYPDVMVLCGEPRFADNQKDTVINPVLIVEVLSDSTRDYDLGGKFQLYRGLSSLQEYLMVAQDRVHVEHWIRQQGNNGTLVEYGGREQNIQLVSVGCALSLAEVYANVEFTGQ